MNVRAPSMPLLLALLIMLGLAGCRGEAAEAPLKGATIGGAFSLINQDNQPVTDRDFAGRYRLMYFGFANCPDVCPVDLAVIGAGLRRFEETDPERAAQVQPIFITVDPERDTPDQLKRYVGNFHPRLIGLTGTPEQIQRVVRSYGGTSMRGEAGPGGGYNVDHTRTILLMGPQGEPIAIVPHDRGAEGVAEELGRWVR